MRFAPTVPGERRPKQRGAAEDTAEPQLPQHVQRLIKQAQLEVGSGRGGGRAEAVWHKKWKKEIHKTQVDPCDLKGTRGFHLHP